MFDAIDMGQGKQPEASNRTAAAIRRHSESVPSIPLVQLMQQSPTIAELLLGTHSPCKSRNEIAPP